MEFINRLKELTPKRWAGIGMLFCTFGLGPIISFFHKYISVPLIIGKTGRKGIMPEA